MDADMVDEIAKVDRSVNAGALERSRRAAEQLAQAGIELGGYRISPELGGTSSMPPSAFEQRSW